MFTCDGPSVTSLKPVDDGFVVVVAHQRIGIDGVLGTLAHGLLDGRCYGKVHVGYPQGYNPLFAFVPLDTARAPSLYDFVKVVFHFFRCFDIRSFVISMFRSFDINH